jgi:plastocyanin
MENGRIETPQDVTIAAGDTITWIGLDRHNVAQTDSPTGQTHIGNSPYSGTVGATSAYSFKFATTGVFYYICQAHVSLGMRGSITVATPWTCGGKSNRMWRKRNLRVAGHL